MEGVEFRSADVFDDGVEIRLATGGRGAALSVGDANRSDSTCHYVAIRHSGIWMDVSSNNGKFTRQMWLNCITDE